MSLLAPLIMATAIGISRHPSSNSQDAAKALAKATFVQTGMDKRVKYWERRFVPEKLKEYGPWIANIIKIQQERRITYEWTF